MKTRIISALSISFLLAATMSCQQDNTPVGAPSGKIRANVNATSLVTKSSYSADEELVRTFVLNEEDSLILQEYVSDNLSQPFMGGGITTKGTVITTENISTEYGLFGMEGFLDNYTEIDSPAAPALTDGDQYVCSGYSTYSNGDWVLTDAPDGNQYPWLDKIQYTFWSYAPMVHGGTYSYGSTGSRGEATITDYVNPTSSSDQKDILFAYNNRWYNDENNSEFVDINFRHALADIYFDVSKITDFTVEGIKIVGAYSKGSCTVTGADLSDSDVTKAFDWALSTSTTDDFEMEGNDDHFFMIPQDLPSGAKLGVTLKDANNIESYVEIPFSTSWKAGKYYKYVLTYEGELSVAVDEVFSNNVKTNVRAMNTSVAEVIYIRMAVTANWVNEDGDFTAPCDFVNDENLEGDFGENWYYNPADGFYYYTLGVQPGKKTNNFLFTEYPAPESPEEGFSLEMTVIAQGVKYDLAKAEEAWGISGILTETIETPNN